MTTRGGARAAQAKTTMRRRKCQTPDGARRNDGYAYRLTYGAICGAPNTSMKEKALDLQGLLGTGGERGIRTLDKAFDPILP